MAGAGARGQLVLVRDLDRACRLAETQPDVTRLWLWTPPALEQLAKGERAASRWIPPLDMSIILAGSSEDVWSEALFSTFIVVEQGSVLNVSGHAIVAALVRRCGSDAGYLLARLPVEAGELVHWGVADALVERGTDPLEWVRRWIGGRSIPALASAAYLLRNRMGGEVLERNEFARLFSLGEPQEGLRRFLAKRPLDFSATTEWEIA